MDLTASLRDHVCLYASFDASMDADIVRGQPDATWDSNLVHHEPTLGRHGGGALCFTAADHGWDKHEFTYRARGNFPYSADGFEGTISLWLNGDPDADLNDAYPVDPFHISRHAADGAFYLDLTKPSDERYGSPRKLRFGIYGDSPERNRFVGGQLLLVGELGWSAGEWHHIVATWRNANSGREDGAAAVYIDGVRRCWMEGYAHTVTWDIDDLTIGLGERYAGLMDDLLVLDRALSDEAILELNRLAAPLTSVL